MLKKINKIMGDNPRFKRFQKPLEAANVCQAARALGKGRFEVISFRGGLLTLAVSSGAQASNLQAESETLISEINEKLGKKMVERVRFRVV